MEFSPPEYWSRYLSLLQGIFPTQGLNLGLWHCRKIPYHLSHQRSPFGGKTDTNKPSAYTIQSSETALERMELEVLEKRFISQKVKTSFLKYSSPHHKRIFTRLFVCLQCGRPRFNPWVRKIPWRRKWQPTPAFLPGESHGRRSLVGYSPRGCKESDTTERLHFHLTIYNHPYLYLPPYL